MDWLKEMTKTWNLKGGFVLYEILSFFFSVPSALLVQWLLERLKIRVITANIGTLSLKPFESFVLSPVYYVLLRTVFPIFILLFLFAFASLFYRHRIKPILLFLEKREDGQLFFEDELSKGIYHLVHDLEELQELNIQNMMKLHEAAKLQDTVMHEIKNPLAVLRGDIEILNQFYSEKDKNLHKITDSMQRNERRIEAYLDSLSIKRNIHQITADLQSMTIADFIHLIKPKQKEPTLQIEFTVQITDLNQKVAIDTQLFTACFNNVLKNAEKYARRKIKIFLTELDESVILATLDDGAGFSQTAMKNYDQAYFSENPSSGNMGLGLYLTKIMLEKQNIKLQISNKNGACVQFILKKI